MEANGSFREEYGIGWDMLTKVQMSEDGVIELGWALKVTRDVQIRSCRTMVLMEPPYFRMKCRGKKYNISISRNCSTKTSTTGEFHFKNFMKEI